MLWQGNEKVGRKGKTKGGGRKEGEVKKEGEACLCVSVCVCVCVCCVCVEVQLSHTLRAATTQAALRRLKKLDKD
jgi:hypothetical protein